MPCRVFLLLLVTSSFGLQASATKALEKILATKHANIVIIYADDLGYGDVGCYNPERGKIPTPHIDQL
ncbi:MAG: arylsulfatase, partial [Bythopirellula sp.]